MTGKLAVSTSGHDRGRIYVIVKEEHDLVYLSDGKIKLVEHPKKKNKKHIQIIKRLPNEVIQLLEGTKFSDLNIKRAIKLYMKKQEEN
ncbi:Uncharacterised protein [uncultured Roseburia sp.]|uniref:KOW domain-containing RNA-binding protein n=1 Tax=Brotonthovivens ammoniilytica TaxID=2981725 RepID=A0ABT2TK80_9FIRM|nr:KOW domain-containing RNA-binding protein [Brotonthovivens ammoniilytica]MCU6762236.1 KOW domain-containing RNA-binding protein [Brotonthovivens ammoniilytica]SCI59709.1 Uncharacterised protein [uncultured Roseburia sp.]